MGRYKQRGHDGHVDFKRRLTQWIEDIEKEFRREGSECKINKKGLWRFMRKQEVW